MNSRPIFLLLHMCYLDVITVTRTQLSLSYLYPKMRNTSFYTRCKLAISAAKQCKISQPVKVPGLQNVALHGNIHIRHVHNLTYIHIKMT